MMRRSRDRLNEYQQRADAGDPDAQISLAWEYVSGEHVEKDLEKAVALLRTAESGSPRLAHFYLAKVKILGGDTTFVNELIRDCEAGFGPALYLMGVAAERGLVNGASKDDALRYFRLAAERGHLIAKFFAKRLEKKGTIEWLKSVPSQVGLFFEIFITKFRNPRDLSVLI